MYRFARKSTVLLLAVAVSILVAACGSNSQSSSAKQTELTVSAAASLTDALNEIQPLFEKAHPDIKLVFNLAHRERCSSRSSRELRRTCFSPRLLRT